MSMETIYILIGFNIGGVMAITLASFIPYDGKRNGRNTWKKERRGAYAVLAFVACLNLTCLILGILHSTLPITITAIICLLTIPGFLYWIRSYSVTQPKVNSSNS